MPGNSIAYCAYTCASVHAHISKSYPLETLKGVFTEKKAKFMGKKLIKLVTKTSYTLDF